MSVGGRRRHSSTAPKGRRREMWRRSDLFIHVSMVNILAKNAYFPPPTSQDPYFFPVFAALRGTNMSHICWNRARSAKILLFLTHMCQISLKIDLKQYNLGKFFLFCMSNFWARSLFLPHFSGLLIPPEGVLLARISTVDLKPFSPYLRDSIHPSILGVTDTKIEDFYGFWHFMLNKRLKLKGKKLQ